MIIKKVICLGLLLYQLVLEGICQQDNPSKRDVLNAIELRVTEESSTDSEIFDLSNFYKFSKGKPLDQRPEVRLSAKNPEWTSLFRFDRESQKLFVAQRLDREALCNSGTEKCHVNLALSVVGRELLKLNIEIVDINDYPPTFSERNHQVHVSELTQPPEIVFQFQPAVDLDYGNNARMSFSLHPPGSPFRLEVERNSLDKVVDLRIGLTDRLDRETRSSYRLLVLATDSGSPSLTGSTVIDIRVDDENDNQPVFEQSQYSAEVKQDDPVGRTVLVVKATDSDEGQNARIKYHFPKKTASMYGRLFSIDRDSGEIKLTSKVTDHRNLESPYKLVVFAENYGPNEIPTSTNVLIRVVNSNNNAPVISLESQFRGSDPGNLIIEENNVPDFAIAKILAQDSDMGEGGLVDCKVKEKRAFYVTRIDSNTFQLVVKDPLDREREGLHKINVECEDMGNPPLSSSFHINLIVTDQDDNPPRFVKPLYLGTVGENNPPGASILSLEVEDLDLDPANSRSDFFVEPHYEHLFRVDQSTGTLIALVSFDREQNDRFSFHVFAKGGKLPGDNSSYKHVAKTMVNLTVMDVDDELPRFEQPWFKFDVKENMPAGTVVGKVKAVDLDLPPNNAVHYSLPSVLSAVLKVYDAATGQRLNVKSPELPFGIDPSSGTIFTKAPLDRELQSRYEFSVHVKNDSASVFVDVIDLNDNPPQWLHPKPDSCQKAESLRVKGNLTFGQQLATLVAQDQDMDKNSEIVYRILSGNEMSQFSLDGKSGKLSWNSYLSGLMQRPNLCQVRLAFQTEDAGEPSLTSQTACLEVVFEECLAYLERQQNSSPISFGESSEGGQTRGHLSELYIIIIVAVLIVCMIIAVVLTAFICVTRQQTRAMKKNEDFRRGDLRASLPLTGPDNEAVLVLDRSSTNESSDQLTGILVSLRSAEQLGRLQLRSLAPSKDSLMSTSLSFHRERDADSGYADVSPV